MRGDGDDVNAGRLFTWGSNFFGQVGQDENFTGMAFQHDEDEEDEQPSPRLLSPVKSVRFTNISSGYFHNAALSVNGEVYTWGGGVLGHGDDVNDATPRKVEFVDKFGIKGVSCSGYGTFAWSDRKVFAWGYLQRGNELEKRRLRHIVRF